MDPIPDPSPDEALRTHQFAEQALDELGRRAEADGMNLTLLHTAICVASVGFLANQYGYAQAIGFLEQLKETVRSLAPQEQR